MTKKIFAITTLFALIGSVGANAANLRQNRFLVQEAITAAERFRRPGDGELRRAEDNLSQVQRDIYDLRPSFDKSQLERSLDDALWALRDYRLPDYQKADAVVRSGRNALVSLDRLERDSQQDNRGVRRELDRSIESLERASRLTRDLRFGEAQNEIIAAQNTLACHQMRDRDIESAKRELDRAYQILNDRYRHPRQIQDDSDRSLRAARDLILRSRLYTEGDSRPDGRDELARTRNFSSRYSTTEYVDVGRQEGRIMGLEFTARDSSLRIDEIEVVYGNGRSEVFAGGFVNDGSTLRLDLRGNDRLVQRIRVTAQSMNGRRPFGEGYFVIRAIR
jgi:hypothetical protein